jgi:ribonuclease Z
VSTVCLTHSHADHTLGLAGLLQTWQFQGRTDPLEVVVPTGGVAAVTALKTAVGGALPFHMEITTVSAGTVAIDGDGDILKALPAQHPGPAVGYGIFEEDRAGQFQPDTAEALGVPPGPAFGRLQSGTPVEVSDGTVVTPTEVTGPPRRGRRFVYTGDTRPVLDASDVPTPIDVLVHEATFRREHASRAEQTGHSTAAEAGRVADAVNKVLMLTHLSPRYETVKGFEKEAHSQTTADVLLADDGLHEPLHYPASESADG